MITAGGKQPGFKGRMDAETTAVISTKIKLTGKVAKLDL